MSLRELLANKDFSIIVSLPENRLDLAEAAMNAGVDGLKFHINVSHRASGNDFKGVSEYTDIFQQVREKFSGPIGIVLGDETEKVNQEDTEKLKKLGFNYYSLYAKHIGSKILLQNNLEHTVAVDDKFQDNQIAAIKNFDVEAIELSVVKKDDYGKVLHFEDVLKYRSFRNKTDLPLIVPSQKKLVPEDITLLKKAGVNAVMLGVVTIGNTAESIYETVSIFTKNNR